MPASDPWPTRTTPTVAHPSSAWRSAGSSGIGLRRQPRQVRRQRLDVGVAHPVEDLAHRRVGAGALAVAIADHRVDEVVLALAREARHLVASREGGQVALAAVHLPGELLRARL